MSREVAIPYKVTIEGVGIITFMAHTHWEACDKAYTAFSTRQPDRKKYTAKPKY